MQLVLNTKSMIENQNGGKKNESIRYRICKEFYPHGKRWMGVGTVSYTHLTLPTIA